MIIKVGKSIIASDNKRRLIARVVSAVITGISVTTAGGMIIAGIFSLLIQWELTQNCGYNCNEFFQHLPKESTHVIYGEKATGNVLISDTKQSDEVLIFTPETSTLAYSTKGEDTKTIVKEYKRARKKAKVQTFDNFRKTDPVLSQFNNLEEPYVEQKKCELREEALQEWPDL